MAKSERISDTHDYLIIEKLKTCRTTAFFGDVSVDDHVFTGGSVTEYSVLACG